MGKTRKGFKVWFDNTFVSKKTSKKKLVLSIVSLILSVVTLVSGTYCWFSLMKAEGKAQNVYLNVGKGLRVNDLGNSSQKFKDDSYLLPASSVDGRNLFFPTDGTDFSDQTTRMTFRSANAGDRNFDYVQLDFNLTAEANYTGIYLDKSTSLKIHVPNDADATYREQAKKAEKALRTAIYYDGMEKPVVFTSQMNPKYVDAVDDIDRTTGRFIQSGNQVAYPFKNYSYGKKQLAMLNQGETRPFSLIIWLEGTDENCTSTNVMLKQLELNLKFTTSWDNTVEINFKDQTAGSAVANMLESHPEYSLVLDYTDTAHKINNLKFTMQKVTPNDYTQMKCNIPDIAVSDLTFQILDGADDDNVVYQWNTSPSGGSTLSRGTATEYTADTLDTNTTGLSNDSRGHWHDGDIEDHGEGHDDGGGISDDNDW